MARTLPAGPIVRHAEPFRGSILLERRAALRLALCGLFLRTRQSGRSDQRPLVITADFLNEMQADLFGRIAARAA